MRVTRSRRVRGAAMVEFAAVLMLLLTVIFGAIECDRIAMVYASVANAARIGTRYAIVHGGTRTGTGDPASGATDPSKVIDVVKEWARLGFLDPDRLNIEVSYPASTDPTKDPGNTPGSNVVVTVSYPYDALTFIPVSMTLSSTSRGVIVF